MYTPNFLLVDRLIHSRTAPWDVKALLLPLKDEFYTMLRSCPWNPAARAYSVSRADIVLFAHGNRALIRVCLEVVRLASPAGQSFGQVSIEPDRSGQSRPGSVRMQ